MIKILGAEVTDSFINACDGVQKDPKLILKWSKIGQNPFESYYFIIIKYK